MNYTGTEYPPRN